MMTKNEALKILKSWNGGIFVESKDGNLSHGYLFSEVTEAISLAITALTEKVQDQWIPVSKKLPPVNSEVIVTDRDVLTSYQATYVGNGYWECDNGLFNDRIVAWKWFPEPYNESENNGQKAIEDMQYCERYEQAYNPDDGSM